MEKETHEEPEEIILSNNELFENMVADFNLMNDKMKILYAIQGTGNGHISRARDIIPVLQKKARWIS